MYIVFVKIFKLQMKYTTKLYFICDYFFFNKNNTFIYKYAYTRIGTIKMVLQDDSKPSIIYKINDNLFFLPFMMTIVKSFFFTYHTVNKMDIVD